MEAYRYKALDAAGRAVSGVVQADTARQARAQLRAQGLLPSAIDEIGARQRARQPWSRGISASGLSLLTRQMSSLLGSGLTVEQTLSALIEETVDPIARDVLAGVKAEVTAGLSLASALGAYERSFPTFYRALVRGGEDSGALPRVLEHLADYLDSRQELKQKTALALLYPVLVTVVALLIVAGLLIYVVPQVVQVFQQSHQSLPLLTRGLIALSDFLRMAWPYLAALAAVLGMLTVAVLRRKGPRRVWDAGLLRTPWLGPLIRGVNASRFASTLAILIGGGVPLLTALHSAAGVVSNSAMRAAVEAAVERVREGTSLAQALGATRAFSPLLVHLVAGGEVSGKLERMLERAARLEAQALERRLAVFLTVLEPAMILLLGGMVLTIVLAIMLPIIEINQLVH